MEEHMKSEKVQVKEKNAKVAQKSAKAKTEEKLEPCDKDFTPETARLEDKDNACDDGVQ
jgi:hypothetical protein